MTWKFKARKRKKKRITQMKNETVNRNKQYNRTVIILYYDAGEDDDDEDENCCHCCYLLHLLFLDDDVDSHFFKEICICMHELSSTATTL